jgi:hypothetical protein
MAVLDAKYPNLYDLASMPENKDAADVINMLAAYNPVLEDAPAFEMNKGTYHLTTVRTGLPTVTWGQLYAGIPATKGSRQVVKDTAGFIESASEVDCRLVDDFQDAADKASIRMEEAEGHIEAMAQEAATAIFYHNSATDPKKPTGLSPRFNDLSGAENASQIVDGGGTGSDNTSIWIVTWDKTACHLIYPKGTMAGVKREDCGKIPVTDGSGNRYMAYREEFKWHFGLTVRNWQYVARVCNIDVSDLEIDSADGGADILNLLTEAYYRHKGRRVAKGKTFIYMNTTIVKYLDFQARNSTGKNLFLTYSEFGPNAKEVLNFRGIPIRECDAIVNTEARVV